MEKVNLNRQVFDKDKFNKTVDTSFSQLGVKKEDPSFFDPQLGTVGDFFTLYSNLFYEIPKSGEINSHEFLIKESTEYTGFEQFNEEINSLLLEIKDLREENLDLRQQIVNLTLKSLPKDEEEKVRNKVLEDIDNIKSNVPNDYIPRSEVPRVYTTPKTTTTTQETTTEDFPPSNPNTNTNTNKRGGGVFKNQEDKIEGP